MSITTRSNRPAAHFDRATRANHHSNAKPKKKAVSVSLVFSPAEVGVDAKKKAKPQHVAVSENKVEEKIFKHFGLDAGKDKELIKERLKTQENPFDAVKTTGDLRVQLNPKTQQYEATADIEKGLYQELQGKAAQFKSEEAAKNQIAASASKNPNELNAAKNGIDTAAQQKLELETKLIENQQRATSFSATSDSDRSVRSLVNVIENVTGTHDPFNSTVAGQQLNRLSVSTLRLAGKASEAVDNAEGRLHDKVRDYLPESLNQHLDQARRKDLEVAKSLQYADSAVTGEDRYIDNIAKQEGRKIPIAEDLANKAMYFPEGIPNAIDSAIKGDFKDDDGSYSDFVGKAVGGLNPVADVRDIVANTKNVSEGKPGAWVGLMAASVGAIPIIGDTGKILMRAEKDVIKETVERLVKEGVEKEVAEKMAKEEVGGLVKEAETKIAKEEAERVAKEAIEKQYDEIAKDGHAVQRHGESISEGQLDERAVNGKDPITGTTDDAFRRNPDGTPKPHRSGKDATKFTSKESLVKAEEYVKNTQQYKDALQDAIDSGKEVIVIEKSVKLEDIYGADFKDQVFGKTRLGSKNHPTGSVETDFTDGTVKAIFKKDASGKWNLDTMYPEPK